MNQYKGFELFADIEDDALRTRNRAVVLTNMAHDHSRNRKISPNGAGLILGYFKALPENERKAVEEEFLKQMKERGWELVKSN